MRSRTRRGATARALTAIAVAAGVLVVAAGVTAYASTRQDSPAYRTATVSTQTVQQVLQATGTIEPGTAATVSFPVSGTVAAVRVAVGDTVRAGELLAWLDTTALRSAVAYAAAGVADAGLTLHQAETAQSSTSGSGTSGSSASSGSGSSTVSMARAQQKLLASVRQVDRALATAKTDLATAATLCAGTPSPAPSASPSASASPSPSTAPAPTAAPTTCAQAQELVLSDETRVLQLQQGVSAQEAALDRLLATASRQSSSGNRSGSTSAASATTAVSAAQLAADQAAVDAAQAELAVARQNLAQAVIVSPFAGTVSSVGLTVGQTATAGSASSAIDVIDPVLHSVSVPVDVAEVPLVEVGQQATVVPDGTGRPLAATVSYVAAAPTTSGGSSYLVRLTFGGTPAGLRDGIQASVTLVVAEAKDALSVPTSAVQHLGALTYVLLLQGDTQQRQVVTVGAVGPLYTQITGGLSAGQQVVLADVRAAIPTSTINNRFARFAGAAGLGGLGGAGGFVPGGGPSKG